MPERIYVGNGKEKTFDKGGSIVTITIDVDDLINACKDYGFTTEAGKRKIKLKVGTRRDIDRYGNSHYCEVDTWKPDGQNHAKSSAPASGYQKRPANATATPQRANSGNSVPPDFPDEKIPF